MTKAQIQELVKIYMGQSIRAEITNREGYHTITLIDSNNYVQFVLEMADEGGHKCVFYVQPIDHCASANPFSLRHLADLIESLER